MKTKSNGENKVKIVKSNTVKSNIVTLKSDKSKKSGMDWFFWSIAILLLLAGIVANHYYSQIMLPLRMLAWVGVLVVAAFSASRTSLGKNLVEFVKDARLELRKVVWPTKQETVQTTLVVIAMVIVLALILWGIDGFLMWIISWLTGQRG